VGIDCRISPFARPMVVKFNMFVSLDGLIWMGVELGAFLDWLRTFQPNKEEDFIRWFIQSKILMGRLIPKLYPFYYLLVFYYWW
jgi:hypothetical protein